MRIAYVHNIELELDSRTQREINSLLKDGNEVLFCGWNKELSKKNERKNILLRNKNIDIENICVKVHKGKGISRNWYSLVLYEIKLCSWFIKNRKKYDAIHGCSFDVVLFALPIAKILKKIIVYDIYDDYADSHVVGKIVYKILKKIDGFLIEHVDTVIICSEKRKDQLASKEAKQLVIVHNTPDIEDVQIDYFKINRSNRMKIVYVGNLYEGRYTYEMAQIITKHPKWELHCGGSGDLAREIHDLADKYDNIFFYGRMNYEETLALEKQCDIVTALYDPRFPNHKFAAPNKFYEAIYLGKPTIMAHDTGMDSYVDKYLLGVTVDFEEKDIEKALEEIERNLRYWKEREESIKRIYNKFFSWEIMENRLIRIYR